MTIYKTRWAALVAGLSAAVILGLLVTVSIAAPPPGKGNGGGGDSGSTLPDDLDVRYRVQYIPLPAGFTNFQVKDVNDAYQVVGWYDFGAIRTGFYYDALTGAMLTASDMVDLRAEWVSTNFIGINNHGAIVGHVRDIDGKRNGLLIYPDAGGYAHKLTSLPGTDECYFRKINDSGDIVGVFYDAGNDSAAFATDAFVYNPGLYNIENYLSPVPFGLPDASWGSVQVSNTRLATAFSDSAGWFWFDVVDLQWSPITSLPLDFGWDLRLSNDGQLAVFEEVAVKKGGPDKTKDRPGVILGDEYIWQGEVNEGRAQLANSMSGANSVGDVVGTLGGSWWLRHADRPDWGYIDLKSMLLINSPADQQLVDNGFGISDMSDREPLTGFPTMVGIKQSPLDVAFVLVPKIVAD